MNYYYKYLKYRQKYEFLKNKIEGNNPNMILVKGKDKIRDLIIIPKLLNQDECNIIKNTNQFAGSKEISDRHDKLKYNHKVWRIEKSQSYWQKLYDKILNTMKLVDSKHWNKLSNKKYHPEVEYILYNVEEGKPLPSIEPHVDNKSLITMVLMLSSKDQYVGGNSYFEGKVKPRKIRLNKGDAVFFRGERTEHWISNVEKGTRDILQIELSRR